MILLALLRYILAGIFIALIGPFLFLYTLRRPTNPSNLYFVSRFLMAGWAKIFGITVEKRNEQNFPIDSTFIVISNHQSNFDVIPCGLTVPKRTVAVGKKSLKWIPIFGQLFWLTGNILLNRKKKEKAKKFLLKVTESMAQKKASLWIMPEGTRSHKSGILPFKKGPFYMAIYSQQKIIPVCISNIKENIDFKKWDAGTIIVNVLEPISVEGLDEGSVPQLASLCQQKITVGVDLLNDELKRKKKKPHQS
ncbi:MAG: 1-acyl-sn-glycerol-3-phosphate acyltransferase [Halobacteriovoraceae bacterium]|nr:1-acyl-sn-glycerol-3-phosphate acyltransferase [Halobacteriovoraceae bacterium]